MKASRYVADLREHASHSLIHLELTGQFDQSNLDFIEGEPCIESLRSFEVLEMIRLEVVTLYQKVEAENKLDLTVFNERADDSTLQALKADPEELEVDMVHIPWWSLNAWLRSFRCPPKD